MIRLTSSLLNVVIVGAATFLAAACGASGAAEPQLSSAKQNLPDGARVYARECQGCHGANGEGVDGKPAIMGSGALPERRHAKSAMSGSPDQPGRMSGVGVQEEDSRPPFKTAKDVYDFIAGTMPPPSGGLSPKEGWAVTSFVLSAHGVQVPAGGLTDENAASVVVNP